MTRFFEDILAHLAPTSGLATHRPAEHVAGASGFHKPPEAPASHPRWRASAGTPSAPTRSSSGPRRIRMVRLLRSTDAVVTSALTCLARTAAQWHLQWRTPRPTFRSLAPRPEATG